VTSTEPDAATEGRYAIRQLLVEQVRWEATGVISIRLVDPAGGILPEWAPGAHLDILLPSGGGVRQYSLCGDPTDRRSYTVAVLRDQHGRGGSRELHDTALVGRTISVRGPRNHFKLRDDADDYVLIAGGIGITPILTMVRHLSQQGFSYRLVYGGRSRQTMAFLRDLEVVGGAVDVVPEDEQGLPDLDAVLDAAGPATAVYCCGPEGLLRAVEAGCQRRNLPVHIERFVAGGRSEARRQDRGAPVAAPADDTSETFQVELKQSGLTLDVPPDRTILEVVREHRPEVLSDCEEGFCGACETPVLEGRPDHRDTILDEREREASETMMICVSRSCSKKLTLDL
jgi:ferredoxin-NADP reductase